MVQLVLILDNIRSAANVGSILRTADSAGVKQVYCCGITPYPKALKDDRDPVVSARNTREIAKTALGAERSVKIEYTSGTTEAIAKCRAEGRTIYGLEQTPNSTNLMHETARLPAALVLGNDVSGVSAESLNECDSVLEIPQAGDKESLNVAVAAGIAVYQILHTEK